MFDEYLAIAVLGVVAVVIPLLAVLLGELVGPRRPTQVKGEPYESGMKAIGPGQRRVPVKFYRIAVLFILFDIEIIFMYPWAVLFFNVDQQGFLFLEMLVFMIVLLVGFVYAWKQGALEWD
jgi:NADH-quinone oxidoreductase subunit A